MAAIFQDGTLPDDVENESKVMEFLKKLREERLEKDGHL